MGKGRLRICVVDGLGGRIGAALIKRLREVYGDGIEIIALGVNAVATAQMLKAMADRGATGEGPILMTVPTADIVLGTISIVLANAMMGEVTPKIASAIASAPARKILLPLTQERVEIAGVIQEPLPHLVEMVVVKLRQEVTADV